MRRAFPIIKQITIATIALLNRWLSLFVFIVAIFFIAEHNHYIVALGPSFFKNA
jgi:hypothetical protein